MRFNITHTQSFVTALNGIAMPHLVMVTVSEKFLSRLGCQGNCEIKGYVNTWCCIWIVLSDAVTPRQSTLTQ